MADDLAWDRVGSYLIDLVPPRGSEMKKMEAYAARENFPIIGPAAGYFCYQTALMTGAKNVFELGSGYGYSTAWFAMAVRENGGGAVHHVVWDEGLSRMARGHMKAMKLDDLIQYHIGEAIQTLRETQGPFDLIFNDIDKHGYPESLPVIKEKLRSGGILVIDNMLWHGRIFDGSDKSIETEAIREFTREITNDPDWVATLAPIRDGMIVGYKR
jgi:predicted O-methyltransferase YrrM